MQVTMCLASIFCLLVLNACSTTGGKQANQDPITRGVITWDIKQQVPLPTEGDKERTLFVTFIDSPELSERIRGTMRSAGFVLVEDKRSADVIYEFSGAYHALRAGTGRSVKLPLQQFIPNPDRKIPTRPGKVTSLDTMFTLSPIAGLFMHITYNAFDTGLRDGFNGLVAGDPDGFCVNADLCDYRQVAAVGIQRTDKAASSSHLVLTYTLNKELIPLDMFVQAALLASKSFQIPPEAFVPTDRLGKTPPLPVAQSRWIPPVLEGRTSGQ